MRNAVIACTVAQALCIAAPRAILVVRQRVAPVTCNKSTAVMAPPCIGIDLGAAKTMVVGETGEIVRNELGGHSSAPLVGFSGDERGARVAAELVPDDLARFSYYHRFCCT